MEASSTLTIEEPAFSAVLCQFLDQIDFKNVLGLVAENEFETLKNLAICFPTSIARKGGIFKEILQKGVVDLREQSFAEI